MKVLYSWLKDFIDLKLEPAELADHLNHLGFEVEEMTETGASFTDVVVGEVLKVDKHPNADRLSVCEVTDGRETFPVVCGAPNVAAGQRVPFAKVGAKLPGGFKIKKSKIRGAVSQGMICSTKELGMPDDGSNGSGIHVIEGQSTLGEDFAGKLGGQDAVFDVDITPNRPDCLSHYGLARELAVYYDLPLKPFQTEKFSEDGPKPTPVEVLEPSECPRYLGRVIEGVKVGPSPEWLARRLEAVGLRPINNVVDVTNYVLLETGQPFHAFDLDKLEGSKILVRCAKEGEKLQALDGKEYALTPENLVIADEKRPVAAAGVIGGEPTSVTEATKRVFLEIACFRPGRVRRSARSLGVSTDSSYRFERGTDRGGMEAAAARAVSLFLSMTGGKAGPGSDTDPKVPEAPPVEVTAARINRILGTEFSDKKVEGVLRRIAPQTKAAEGKLVLHPPTYRADLESAADLAEEVARHLGYGAVPSEAASVRLRMPESLPVHEQTESLRDMLTGVGFCEAYSYDFISAADIEKFYSVPPPENALRLANPISEDWVYMRPSLLIGLLRSARLNANRGAHSVRLFEAGKAYLLHGGEVVERFLVSGIMAGPQAAGHWRTKSGEPDLFTVKGTLESLLAGIPYAWRATEASGPIYHPKASLEIMLDGRLLGKAGLAHPELLKRWDISWPGTALFELDVELLTPKTVSRSKFKPYSTFPAASRDLSVLVDRGTPYGSLLSTVRRSRPANLGNMELVDVFEEGKSLPAGKKSLTIRFVFSRGDRTLRDEEVRKSMDSILGTLKKACGAELRS